MGVVHDLHGVGDDLSRWKGIAHARMAHGDAVAHRWHAEGERHAARFLDALAHLFHQPVQMDVSRNDVVERVGDTDEGLVHVIVGQSAGPQQAPAGRLGQPLLHGIASHDILNNMKK